MPDAAPRVKLTNVPHAEIKGWRGIRIDCSECGHVFHGATERGAREIRTLHLRNWHGLEEDAEDA